MALFEEIRETPTKDLAPCVGTSRDTLFDWLVKRAEADLEVARALATAEMQTVDHIKRLEATLINQINGFQNQILESREVEINALKSDIFACTERVIRIERAEITGKVTKEFVHDTVSVLQKQLAALQDDLETRYSEFAKVADMSGAQIRALENQIAEKLEAITTTTRNTQHFNSQVQSLTDRVVHSESVSWESLTIAARTAEQLERSTGILRQEIASVKTIFAQFTDSEFHQRVAKSTLEELAKHLGVQIEHIKAQLTEQHDARLAYDARFGHLDSGLAMLAERLAKTESVSVEIYKRHQAEATSASTFHKNTADELTTLSAKVSECLETQAAIRNLDSSLRARVEEWQHQAAQKFVLLESHAAGWDKTASDLTASLGAQVVAQEIRIEEQLRVLKSHLDECLRLGPVIEKLEQRLAETESVAQSAQFRANASATQADEFEDGVKSSIAALHRELATLAGQRQAFQSPDEVMCAIQLKLGAKFDELQKELAVEREGFDHWVKGLRESFGSELSAMQARLSDRQSQIEHRYARLERWEDTVKTNLECLEARLQKDAGCQEHDYQAWQTLQAELGVLHQRTSRLESQTSQAEDRLTTVNQRNDKLHQELSALAELLQQNLLPTYDSIMSDLQETLSRRLEEFDSELMDKLRLSETSQNERAQKADENLVALTSDVQFLKLALEDARADPGEMPPALEESLREKIRELNKALAEKLTHIETSAAEELRTASEAINGLKSEFAAMESINSQRLTALAASSNRAVEESVAAAIQQLKEQLAHEMAGFEKRYVERTHPTEQAISDLTSEVALFRRDLRPRQISDVSLEPALRGLEEKLTAEMQHLRYDIAQAVEAFDRRGIEITELKERSQSLVERVSQLSAAVQVAQNTVPLAARSAAPRPEGTALPSSPANVRDDTPAETKASNEKEQLTKLQERMSSEIERVRAELKERSGRWKVRKSAS